MKEIILSLVASYLFVMNGVGLVTMGIDKYRAIKKGWRISERTLLLIAFMGGGLGSFLGMILFSHKTKHPKFFILLPLSAILSIILIYYGMNH